MLKYFKNYFSFLCVATLLVLMGLIFLSGASSIKIFAESISSAPYFSAKIGDKSYSNGEAIFLNNGQVLNISFGKPNGNAYTANVYSNQEEIGDYAVATIESRFNMSINGATVNTENYKNAGLFTIGTYFYAPLYPTDPTTQDIQEFKFFEMQINLQNQTYFPTGEYVLTFNNYEEYSGTDFKTSKNQSFSVTFYIFNTTDYFTSDSAENANVEFSNTRMISKSDTAYKNFYFFNYSNYNNASISGNYLPLVKFNPTMFELEITKSYQGLTQNCIVSYYAQNYVILSNETQESFIDVTFNSKTTQLEVIFKDLGDYSIKYNFIYKNGNGQVKQLSNPHIDSFKQDILYVYGYQMFYFDINDQQKQEFKQVTSGATSGEYSADVSYLVPYEELFDDSLENVASDETILAAVQGKTPASTNQPALSVLYNGSLIASASYYYTFDNKAGTWANDGNEYLKTPYKNGSFSDAGTYLLKVVYTFANNYNSSGIRATAQYFTQYFYFSITNSTAGLNFAELVDDGQNITENKLSSNAFTQNHVKITLAKQSVFNSDVRLLIEGKQFNVRNYSPITTIYASNTEQYYTVTENMNYRLTLYFGISKPQISYFTIDKTNFDGVEILTANESNSSSQYYVKGGNVDFFTNSAVTVQWNEKPSGASSTAYYKYIPFSNVGFPKAEMSRFINDYAIPTNYALNFSLNDDLAKAQYTNSKDLSLLTGNYIFKEQGFYIIHLSDSAGNWQYISFCIDKTEINIWQYLPSSSTYQTQQNFNVISSDTTLQWGKYKFIALNINLRELQDIKDTWVRDVLTSKYNNLSDNDIQASQYDQNDLFFAPEIASIALIQEGTSYSKLNNQTTYSISITKIVQGIEIVNEITHILYLIDESNPLFKNASSLSNADYTNGASKNYSVTISTDAARANVIFNSSNSTSNDYSNIGLSSNNLAQAGFTDSRSYNESSYAYSENVDTRTKYFYSTGTTNSGDVSLLTYIFISEPSSSVKVDTVTLYFYPFVKTNGNYVLSQNAIKTVIYDYSNNLDLTSSISTGDFAGYKAYNLNQEFISGSGYRTIDGKYVVVRTYTAESKNSVDTYDFFNRESVFIVDRQNIVSLPENDGTNKSIIGQFIHVNVSDGYTNGQVSFTDLYMAYYQEGALLTTNKLPAVNYVPVAKFGELVNSKFHFFDELKYFYETTSDATNYYLTRFQTEQGLSKSILSASYFGNGTYTTSDFSSSANLNYISNTSFDLNVRIDFASTLNSTRTNIYTSTNDINGFFVSDNFQTAGFYFVTITQNYANGNIYPNVRNTFSYIFEIVSEAPDFDFVDSNNNVIASENSVVGGVSYDMAYTNEEDHVTISWTDPSSEYMAKIDTSGTNGLSNGIKYWTSVDATRRSIKIDSIQVNQLKNSFELDISKFISGTIVYVYMQYEGNSTAQNTSVIKALYIDREAPTYVLNRLIGMNEIGSTSITKLAREYVDVGNNITTDKKMYNVPVTTGGLAYYTFAVNLQSSASIFTRQVAVNGIYTEGYYYYAKEQVSSDDLVISSINSAKDAFATHTLGPANFKENFYYEIIEQDLAGNITIYLVYIVPTVDDNDKIVKYTKPTTDLDNKTAVNYSELSSQGTNVYAKGSWQATNINLYNYQWQLFSVNGKVYMSSPELADNTFYNISDWVDTTTLPSVVEINDILSFTANRSIQKIELLDSTKDVLYPINIWVTDDVLTFKSVSGQEAISITESAYSNGIRVSLSSIAIYSWESSRYNLIYNAESSFLSNNFVSYSNSTLNHIFKINAPHVAYKYVFYDNFGENYIFYHTFGEPTIEDSLNGEVDIVSIMENDGSASLWNVGLGDMTYYYSNVDYYVYIDMYYLTNQSNSLQFTRYSQASIDHQQYGVSVTDGTTTPYYDCKTDRTNPSINILSLNAPDSTNRLEGFTGGIVKYIITLVNVNENPSVAFDNVLQERVLINNLVPDVKVYDKNNEDKSGVLTGDILISGQLTIRYNTIDTSLVESFEKRVTLSFDGGEEEIISSGEVVSEAGSYVVKIYTKIDDTYYLVKTNSFLINESSDEFYNVTIYNPETALWEIISPTDIGLFYNNTYYPKHYLVNTEVYKISTNEEQGIEAYDIGETYTSGGTVTKFYRVSNYANANQSTNQLYDTQIAITYVHSEKLINDNSFYYTSADGQLVNLDGTSAQIIITNSNQNFSAITINYNSYFGIKENAVDIKILYGENELEYTPIKNIESATSNSITISESGTYLISFSDKAGNSHTFADTKYNYASKVFTLTYINGVAFNVNDSNPIENGIYNDKALISLPTSLDSLYDIGGKPKIKVLRNGQDYTEHVIQNEDGYYVLNKSGYYTVSFSAIINSNNLREQAYSFTVLNSTEGLRSFEYSQFQNYEIVSVLKNGISLDLSSYFPHNTYTTGTGNNKVTTKYLKSIMISLYDEITGQGKYEITFRTNYGLAGQTFTANFVIKDLGDVPINISVDEGVKTTDNIIITFNAYNLLEKLGECELKYGNNVLKINQEYVDSLTDYNVEREITEAGTFFVQIINDSGNVLYSYKVIKQEPLNAGSIITIVACVVAAVGLVVVIILLRKKMKIK